MHGPNRETQTATAAEWEAKRDTILSLDETIEFLRYCHRRAPFLFFNGNTFADLGRRLATALFADLPPARLREATSVMAHYIAGVIDRSTMTQAVTELCAVADLHAGDRVKTLRGSTRGQIIRVLEDGRVVWRPRDAEAELIALPESLLPDCR